MMYGSYLPILIFAVIGLAFTGLFWMVSKLVRPRNPTPLKYLTYECGEKPEGPARILGFEYYLFAILFVVFDVVSIFLYLWALIYIDLPSLIILQMYLFVLMLCVVVYYSLRVEGKVWS
jgi:NADH:ubiquinone oxidoreductase subunit 3 (subunit A)